jgi:hypothetical protein
MIPKDIFANLYLELYQAKIKRGGRTICGNDADRPAAPGGLSARAAQTVHAARGGRGAALDALEVIMDHPRRTVRVPRGLSAGASQTVRACCAPVGPRPRDEYQQHLSLLYPDPRLIPLSFLLSLKEKAPHFGIFDSNTPRTLREVLHHVIWVFFEYLILSLRF